MWFTGDCCLSIELDTVHLHSSITCIETESPFLTLHVGRLHIDLLNLTFLLQ